MNPPATEIEALVSGLRMRLMESIGFDPYQSSQFAEAVVCHAAGLSPTPHSARVDGIRDDGLQVEVKFATLAEDGRVEASRGRMCFRGLQGRHVNGKEADVFVFVGNVEGSLRFYVIPACRLSTRRDLEVSLFHDSGAANKWVKYQVPLSFVGEAVEAAFVKGVMYEGWGTKLLFD